MKANEVKATGNCYEAAGRLVMDGMPPFEKLVLCHGKVTGQGPIAGLRIGHAWVEAHGFVIDKSNGNNVVLPRDAYYRLGRVKDEEVTRYTRSEMAEEILSSGNWGPWNLEK